jgi:cell division protein FtsB
MASSKKKVDPISARARTLNDQIAALETEIKKLDTQIQRAPSPKLRSTAIPHGATVSHVSEKSTPAPKAAEHEPVFEEISSKSISARAETESPDHYNDLGVRKYDLPALWGRLRNHFHGPTSTNPRLVNYLAHGGVHGLRPMRYEKRVARNRFLLLVVVLFLILLGVISMFVKNH